MGKIVFDKFAKDLSPLLTERECQSTGIFIINNLIGN